MGYPIGTMPMVKHFRDLDVYKGAMSLVMEIFALSKEFPPDERFTLTDQIRRSSRSICANIAEAWRKRRYEAAFVAKLNDAKPRRAKPKFISRSPLTTNISIARPSKPWTISATR